MYKLQYKLRGVSPSPDQDANRVYIPCTKSTYKYRGRVYYYTILLYYMYTQLYICGRFDL